MTLQLFLLSGSIRQERLSWIEECLKFFFIQLYPETLTHQKTSEVPVFTFFLTGDALYSLSDPELLPIWNIILSFPPVRIVCDHEELMLRGISTGPLRMKFPEQVIETDLKGPEGNTPFWQDLVNATRESKSPLPGTAGWFQTESPYMHRSALYGLRFLSAAAGDHLSIELLAYLDGVHCGHHGQNPSDDENVGAGIVALQEKALAVHVTFTALGSGKSATARGYSTWNDGQGQIISTCTVRPFRIRDISWIIERLCQLHPILAADSAILSLKKQPGPHSFDRAERSSRAPPVIILVTKRPYSTGHADGAISLAVACAHAGILTRVVFIEDGIYCLTGPHRSHAGQGTTSIQDLINMVAGNENLHFFAFTPSFQKRGIAKEKGLNAVLDIGYPGLGKIFFYPPGNVQAGHQRVFFF